MSLTRKAVVTINIGTKFKRMGELTIPTMRDYAKKIGAEFVEINDANLSINASQFSAYWAKFQLYELLNKYDRIIYLDLDVIVRPHCPDLFSIVDEAEFAALYESDYSIAKELLLLEIEEFLGSNPKIDWQDDYFNVGVMVLSKTHKEAFNFYANAAGGNRFPEQTLINYNIKKLNYKVHHLPPIFNHMGFLTIDNNKRGESNIIHYAGVPHEIRERLIEHDLHCFRNNLSPVPQEKMDEFVSEHFNGKRYGDFLYELQTDEKIGLKY